MADGDKPAEGAEVVESVSTEERVDVAEGAKTEEVVKLDESCVTTVESARRSSAGGGSSSLVSDFGKLINAVSIAQQSVSETVALNEPFVTSDSSRVLQHTKNAVSDTLRQIIDSTIKPALASEARKRREQRVSLEIQELKKQRMDYEAEKSCLIFYADEQKDRIDDLSAYAKDLFRTAYPSATDEQLREHTAKLSGDMTGADCPPPSAALALAMTAALPVTRPAAPTTVVSATLTPATTDALMVTCPAAPTTVVSATLTPAMTDALTVTRPAASTTVVSATATTPSSAETSASGLLLGLGEYDDDDLDSDVYDPRVKDMLDVEDRNRGGPS